MKRHLKCPDCKVDLTEDFNPASKCPHCSEEYYFEDVWDHKNWDHCYICGEYLCLEHITEECRNAYMKEFGFTEWHLCFSCEDFQPDYRTCGYYTDWFGFKWDMFKRQINSMIFYKQSIYI